MNKQQDVGEEGKPARRRTHAHYPGRSYEEQWAGVTFPTRRERQRLAKALSGLKDATTLDARMALILLQINGLDNALAFIDDLDRSRRFDPPPLAPDALVLQDVPRTAQEREEVYTWAREHIPQTDTCIIWENWREDGPHHPVIYVKALPFVAFCLVYEAIAGSVPAGMDLELSCREFRCVNPIHTRLVPFEEHGKRALCPGQQTNLAHFMRYVVQTDQDDLNDDQQIDRFTSGLFTVWWTSPHSSDGHVVSDEFDLFYQGKKLDAHEQMQGGGILDMDGVRRIAARIAPGQAPDTIIGTVS